MQPDARVNLVYDPTDLPESARFLESLADRDAGRVVAIVPSGGRGLPSLGYSLLNALGKDPDLAGSGRTARITWERLSAWFVGEGVEELFVSRSYLLDRRGWEHLIEFASECGLRLWLFHQNAKLRRTLKETVRDWPIREWTLEDFEAYWRQRDEAGSGVADSAEPEEEEGSRACLFPVVPHDDFTSFYASCLRLLTPAECAAVRTLCLKARERTFDFVDHASTPADVSTAWPKHLRDVLSEAGSFDEELASVRGAQVAFFMRGYLLRVSVSRMRASAELGRPTVLTAPIAGRLRQYLSTSHATAAVLSIGLQLSPAQLVALEFGAVVNDEVIVAGESLALPPEARTIVAAHLLHRVGEGATADDPLLITVPKQDPGVERVPARYSATGMQRLLREIGNEIGIPLVGHWTRHAGESAEDWARRRGLMSLQPLKLPNRGCQAS